MAKNKIIIDTDPGCDDVLAILLALASSPEDVEIVLISVTYGNVSVKGCLQNVISTFHVIEKERQWRKSQGLPEGFEMLSKHKPMIAVGAEGPLGGQKRQADYYHGIDGLGGVHTSHPHFTPSDTWSHLFVPPPPTPPTNDPITTTAATATHEIPTANSSHAFTPSPRHAVDQILSLLSTHPPGTLTLIALGPLTNFTLAASRAPATFLRARRVSVMMGALSIPGNITPVGEFNTLADPLAAARVYALSSPNPVSTMPPPSSDVLPPYPPADQLGEGRLKAVMFPLDVTTGQKLRERDILDVCKPLMERGSPLAGWVSAFTRSTFERNRGLHVGEETEMCLHDPVVMWNAVTGGEDGWEYDTNVDVRIETQGQWTVGMCVVDRRGRKQLAEKDDLMNGGEMEEVSSDQGGWLSRHRGNRVDVCVGIPGGERGCAEALLATVFGV